MKLITVPSLRPFQEGLLTYRCLSTLLTFIVGMLLLLGNNGGAASSELMFQRVIFLSLFTGGLGAFITVRKVRQLWVEVNTNYVLDRRERTSLMTVWFRHCSDWSFVPFFSFLMSLVLLVYANGAFGSLWLMAYTIMAPIVASVVRAGALSLMTPPMLRAR